MRAVFKAGESRQGFITTTIVPANRSQEPRFGAVDVVIVFALILGLAAVMRLVLAN